MFIARFSAIFATAVMMLGAGVVCGQTYPNKPIRVFTGAPGSSNDTVLRLIAQALTVTLRQPVLVENQGSGIAAIESVVKAPPDGYTLLLFPNQLWVTPLLQNVSFDVTRDFSPISLTSSTPNILFLIPSVPANSVKELIALAKARPGELNYASGNIGATSHLAGELFNSLAGVKLVRVPYKSGSQQVIDLLAGQVQLSFSSLGGMEDHIKSGRLKALAVASARPSALVPGLPTVAATLPGFEAVIIHGMYAPAQTPEAVISLINQEVVRFLNLPETKARLIGIAIEPVGSSPAELNAAVKADIARWSKVIKDANIRVE